MEFTYTTQLLREGGTYIAYSPELDLSSCGDSAEKARQHLHEAATLFLQEARRTGTLDRILEEAGYRREDDQQWRAPEFIGVERSALAL